MFNPPYSRRELLDFDSEFIRVLCLASQETVKGLQWALDRQNFSTRKFKLFLGNLSSVSDQVDADIVLLSLDISQPVPIETLKKLHRKVGLAAFQQPTPQQLLQLGELPLWQVMAWDGSGYEKLAIRLDEAAARFETAINQMRFVEACRSFVKRSEEVVDLLEWVNPPESYRGMRMFVLDPLRGALSVGGKDSDCDLRLPIEHANRAEIGEFRYISGKWSFKHVNDNAPIQIKGQRENLVPGDQIEVERNILHLRRPVRIDEFVRLARRMNIVDEKDTLRVRTKPDELKVVSDICRDLILSGITGELRLTSNQKSGSIYFHDGVIVDSVTGSVSGLKALLRMLAWQNPQWRFNSAKTPQTVRHSDRISLQEFLRIYESWKSAWSKVAPFIPPPQMRLHAIPEKFLERKEFSVKETTVLAALCEYPLVRDLMNYCQGLVDVEIGQVLISLRKQGLIEPVRSS